MGRAVELHIKTLPILEGTVKHEDLGKITTLPYGIVNDPDKNLKATNRNKKAAKSLGYNLNDLTTDQAKEVATKISNDIDKQLSKNSKVGKEYLNLSDNFKTLVIDAMFNTGEVFEKLIKASNTYMLDKNEDTLYDVIKESRRVIKGKTDKGLDNRVGKLATMLGVISNPNDVAEYGLDKVDVLPGDVELAQNFVEQNIDETERMLMDSTPTGEIDPKEEVDPGDEENPRTRRDLPPQAITPRDRNLTGVAPMPTEEVEDVEEVEEVETVPLPREKPTVDDQMAALDFGDLSEAPGSKPIRSAKEEKEYKERMKKATEEGTRVAGEKPDTTTGFEDDEYIPGIEMESRDDTMATGDPDFDAEPMGDMQVSAADIDDTPTGDDIFTRFFETLGDVSYDEGFEVDDLNLKEGGSVKEADFVKHKGEKSDPPPGAKPEEVADDIPAMLSEGEYVLPANVVRYLGLERIMDMHQKVLHEIQQMEDLGMIQNVDENGKPEEDDKEMKFIEPKGEAVSETLIIAAKPKGMMCPPEMAEGGEINRIDRTLDDEALKIRADIANERNPVGFETIFDPDVGVIKIKTPKGDVNVDKGLIGGFSNFEPGPGDQGEDPAEQDALGGTASGGWSLGQSIMDLVSETIGGPGTQSELDDRSMTVGYDVSREVDPGDEDDVGGGYDTSEDDAEEGHDEGVGGGAELQSGGLMARFNTGGEVDYNIAGVGTVAGDMQMGDESEEIEKPKTYEEIRADILGNPFKDMPDLAEDFGDIRSENYLYKNNPVLEGPKLQTRKKRSSYVYDPNAGGGQGSNAYRNDKEVRQLLDKAGVDSEDYAFVMQDYNKGRENIVSGASGGLGLQINEQLKSGLDALSDKRRILREGLKSSDIPEGATNRDIFKKVFFNEVDNFGEELDPSNFQQNDQIQTVINADLDKLAASNKKEDQEALKFLEKFDLDAPAEAGIVNKGISALAGGRQGTTHYDSREERLKRLKGPRSGIMGEGQYVEGVGYVT